MDEILVNISVDQCNDIKDKTFTFLIKLMGFRNQLRINHWQTKSYAEHKLTDSVIELLDKYIDSIGESALGIFERPKLNTISTNISDIAIFTTKWVLEKMCEETREMLAEYKVTEYESIINLLGELDAEIYKSKYLLTLE